MGMCFFIAKNLYHKLKNILTFIIVCAIIKIQGQDRPKGHNKKGENMKKQTAIKYADLLTEISIFQFWADYDALRKKWYIYNVCKRRFYTVKELKSYFGKDV